MSRIIIIMLPLSLTSLEKEIILPRGSIESLSSRKERGGSISRIIIIKIPQSLVFLDKYLMFPCGSI